MQDRESGHTSPTTKSRGTRSKMLTKKMSVEYENRGLCEVNVDNAQVAALHTENNREREINKSLQRDVDMLRAQLAKSEEIRAKQEIAIAEAQAHIAKQQVHLDSLVVENTGLKSQNAAILTDKEGLQKEVLK